MPTLTVTSKEEIMLPEVALRHLGLGAGDQVEYELLAGGQIRIYAVKRTGTIDDLFGMLKRDNQRTVSVEEMNEAIADGWAGIERQR